MALYKNIIPGLVSFDTQLNQIKGFEMCQDFDFFKNIAQKNQLHYKVVLSDNIETPPDYDMRSEYFINKEGFWHYERKIFFWKPKFKYDIINRVFYINKAYASLPFRIGGIFIAGENISHLIELELFLRGCVLLRGIAARVNGKNIGISAPGFNGKTTLLKNLLRKGAQFIAENYLILDLTGGRVFPTCPIFKEVFWQRRRVNSELKELLKRQAVLDSPVILDKLYLTQNSLNPNYQPESKKFIDFLLLNSLFFLNNLFVRSYIYEQGLAGAVSKRIEELAKFTNYQFIEIKNFNFNFLSSV